eukprot:6192681-Lingulodinium_polyedra.AAC.1
MATGKAARNLREGRALRGALGEPTRPPPLRPELPRVPGVGGAVPALAAGRGRSAGLRAGGLPR